MPRKVTFQDEVEIFKHLFSDYNFSDTAAIVGVSAPTVRNRLNSFVDEAENRGLLKLAEQYGVDRQVKELVQLSSELRESEVSSIEECLQGLRVKNVLHDLSVDTPSLRDFVEGVYQEASSQAVDPRTLVSLCFEFRRLKEKTGKGFEQVVAEFEASVETIEELREEIERLESLRRDNKKNYLRELREKDANNSTLKWFTTVREKLADNNIEVEELDELIRLLGNLKELEYDVEAVMNFYEQTEALQKLGESLKIEVNDLRREETELKKAIDERTKILEEEKGLVESIEMLKRRHLTPEKIRDTAEVVINISARQGIDAPEAIDKFYETLESQYDEKLGFHIQIERLKSRREKIEEEIKEKEERLQTLQQNYESRSDAVEKLQQLNQLEVGNQDLLHWNEIIMNIPTDLPSFRKEMETLGSIKKVVEDKQTLVRELHREMDKRKAEIDELKRNHEEIKARTTALTSTLAQGVEENLKKASNVIKEFGQAFLSPETGFKARTLEIVRETHSSLQTLLNTTSMSLSKDLKNLQEIISSMVEEKEAIKVASFEGGKALGQYKALDQISRIFRGERISKFEAFTAINSIMESVEFWLRQNREPQLASECLKFLRALQPYLRRGY